MKNFNLLIIAALITLTTAIIGCGKDDQNGSVVNTAPPGYGYGYGAVQYPPTNCVNGVCNCYNGFNYQGGVNPYCQANNGWGGFPQGNPCYNAFGPTAQPKPTPYGYVCDVPPQFYQPQWQTACITYYVGNLLFYRCHL